MASALGVNRTSSTWRPSATARRLPGSPARCWRRSPAPRRQWACFRRQGLHHRNRRRPAAAARDAVGVRSLFGTIDGVVSYLEFGSRARSASWSSPIVLLRLLPLGITGRFGAGSDGTASSPPTRPSRRRWWWWLFVAALAVTLMAMPTLRRYLRCSSTSRSSVILALLALSMSFLWGYVGILSFGQTTFFGLGGYTYAVLALNVGESRTGPFVAAHPVARCCSPRSSAIS